MRGMKRQFGVAVLVGAGVFLFGGMLLPAPVCLTGRPRARQAGQERPPNLASSPLKVGVVNLEQCLTKYAGLKQIQEDVDKYINSSKAKLAAAENDMKVLKEKIGAAQGQGQKEALYKQYKELQLKYELDSRWDKAKILEMTADVTVKIYNEIKAAAQKVADEQGIQLVLKVEDPLDPENPVDPVRSISYRAVLYANKSVDITEAVIKKMNEKK